MTSRTEDRLAIRDLIENWAVLRDARLWDDFRTVWHDDGVMQATWFQGTADEFIKVSQEGYDKGVRILHFLGGMNIDIKGNRAIAQTKMTISQRGPVDGVLCDVVCTGRFYDFLEKRDRPMGPRAAPADLREGPLRSGRPVGEAQARSGHSASSIRKAIATSPICSTRSATR